MQIVQNDLGRGMCPAAEVVLVVVDEAHKATGNHAYCQVVCNNLDRLQAVVIIMYYGLSTYEIRIEIKFLPFRFLSYCSEDGDLINHQSISMCR